MGQYIERYQKRRLISSYFSVVLSIALVLFLMGMLGLLVLNAKKLADHFKEQVTLSVFLKDSAKAVEIDQLQKSLTMADYTKNAVYVSKEDAAEQYSEEIGENFQEVLGHNPLKNAFDVNLKADFVSPGQVADIAENLSQKTFVEEVSYEDDVVTLLSDNVRKLSLWILLASGVFTIIAVLLINSSIRLSIYSKRFIIKTMQMVGATKKFIRKPFIQNNVKLGILGAVVALLGIALVLYYLNQTFPDLDIFQDTVLLGGLFVGILLMGTLISYVSTFFATQRFLNLRTNDLYY
ncbi:MAG: permease-like cell division protein FtsX [Bacteroidota bacterium]